METIEIKSFEEFHKEFSGWPAQTRYYFRGVSKSYHNYMNKLITIAGSGSGNPFATPPATIRGNITNTTNNNNYPLGYFHLSEIDTVNYLVQ